MARKIENPKQIKTAREFELYLQGCGYQRRQNGTSHAVYSKAGVPSISLPIHGELSAGTRRNLLKVLLGEAYYQKGIA